MLEAAEGLFGPYVWDRFDFVVLPPAFPMGGMENPRMTFLTPTLLAGDRSLVSVLAHELAHSWTGNLVTNATNEDFWLNEGWTVYAERRILEVLYGSESALLAAALGRAELEETIAERAAEGRSTALRYSQKGLDPDLEFSKIPYEKGFLLLVALERAVGRATFDGFVRRYIDRFRFTSITADDFLAFVRAELPETGIDLLAWVDGEGLLPDAPTFQAERLDQIRDRAASGVLPADLGAWSATEQLLFLAEIPQPVPAKVCEALSELLSIRTSRNAEVVSRWLSLSAGSGVPWAMKGADTFVRSVGRTKLLAPVYEALVKSDRDAAVRLYADCRPKYHASTRVSLDRLLTA
jgi:hypothetical protein